MTIINIEVDGYALRVLVDFIYYANEYSERIASAMWWVEDSFKIGAKGLQKAYDAAKSREPKLHYRL